MKYKAILFDLFGTLVPSFPEQEYRDTLRKIASILSVPPQKFWVLWEDMFNESILGVLPGTEAKVVRIGNRMGVKFATSKIREATETMAAYSARYMLPRAEAVEVLSHLKQKGLKIGLVSDCSSETPELWGKTPLAPLVDVAVFSCLVGLRKPDPRIYRLAIQQLAVKPGACWYVGDGSSCELTGAVAVGLQAAQLYIPRENEAYRVGTENWEGRKISSLKEVYFLTST